LGVPDELFFLKDWGQKFFLDIDHEERTAVCLERSARDFAIVAGQRSDVAKGGNHECSPGVNLKP
jgi:hypothetical protein